MTAGLDREARHYPLFLREGPLGLVFRLHHQGITLLPDRICWRHGRAERERALRDIRSIRLQVAHIARHGDMGICTIDFGNRALLTVYGGNHWATPDPERGRTYAAFVRDLHAAIADQAAPGTEFVAGAPAGRQAVVRGIMAVAVAFFVLLPLVLLFITGEAKTLFLAFGGVIFVRPFLKALKRNEARPYTPDNLPAEMIP